jgi:hypothetical protein
LGSSKLWLLLRTTLIILPSPHFGLQCPRAQQKGYFLPACLPAPKPILPWTLSSLWVVMVVILAESRSEWLLAKNVARRR